MTPCLDLEASLGRLRGTDSLRNMLADVLRAERGCEVAKISISIRSTAE